MTDSFMDAIKNEQKRIWGFIQLTPSDELQDQ